MRFLLAFLLPLMVWATGTPVGNPAGVVLGIFAMCGTDPVDCGNGWCCLEGQTCTDGSKGANTMCIDTQLTDNSGQGRFIVNAAYFGKIQQHQTTPPANGTSSSTSKTSSTPQTSTNASPFSAQPASYALISGLVGTIALLLSIL